MLKRSTQTSRSGAIDLDTLRDTVGYMHDDARGRPGLERLSAAFEAVLREIDAVSARRPAAHPPEVAGTRFIPFRR